MDNMFFFNGNILTMDNIKRTVEAVVVKNDRIVFAGNYDEGIKYTNTDTMKIDLNGRTLMPGFNDSHMHLLSYGLSKYKINLTEASSIKEVQKAIDEYKLNEATKVFGDWILGSGWNHENFDEKRIPTKQDLDQVVSDRPVFLQRACYHICVVNSKALEMAGITKDTEDPDGGRIDKDPVTGEPTGVLRENAVSFIYDMLPITDDVDDIKKIIKTSLEDANKVGLTSIQTDDFSHVKSFSKVIEAYNQLKESGELNARINLQTLLEDKQVLKEYLTLGKKTFDGDEWVRFGPLKILADGSLGSRTAALVEPYSDDPTTNGILVYSDEELEEIFEMAYTNDLQLATHAIGDRCMDQVLRLYEKVYNKYPKEDPRFRIIHCQICSEEILDRFSKLGVIADIQPIFVKTDMFVADRRVGEERIKWSYPWKTMKDKGIHISGSSDSPVEKFDPLLGIYTAVTRQKLDTTPAGGWMPQEKLDLYEALQLFTTNSAYSTFEEGIKGMIKEDMLADLIILSDNIEEIDENMIKDMKVDITIVGGKIVYKR